MKKIMKVITGNVIGFMIGALVFGGVLGAVAAVSISASDIAYTTSKNANVTTVKDAVDDLYSRWPVVTINGVTGHVSYLYSQESIAAGAKPVNGSNINIYSNVNFYIRTAVIDGNAVEHNACLKYNDREFCIGPNYWAGTIGAGNSTAAAQTKIKLQRDMEAALGTSASSCTVYDSNSVYCSFGGSSFFVFSTGNVNCAVGSGYVSVSPRGSASFTSG